MSLVPKQEVTIVLTRGGQLKVATGTTRCPLYRLGAVVIILSACEEITPWMLIIARRTSDGGTIYTTHQFALDY
jgi:hypothetical protein